MYACVCLTYVVNSRKDTEYRSVFHGTHSAPGEKPSVLP